MKMDMSSAYAETLAQAFSGRRILHEAGLQPVQEGPNTRAFVHVNRNIFNQAILPPPTSIFILMHCFELLQISVRFYFQ